MIRRPPRSTLFPYTTLFRSPRAIPEIGALYQQILLGAIGDIHQERLAFGGSLNTLLHHLKLNIDRKSTRLNSSHLGISYAVFCFKKKKCTSLEDVIRVVAVV